VNLELRTRGSLDVLPPEPAGRITRTVGDWMVGVRETPKGRTCFAYTPAAQVSPVSWRLLAPSLIFQMTPDGDEVAQRFDVAQEYADANSVRASVTLAGGQSQPLPLANSQGGLSAASACASGQGVCLNTDMLRNLTRGSRVTLTGRPRAGVKLNPGQQAGSVSYSLNGYQAAMYAMAFECGRRDFANSLVIR
jgi:hypothetical protein